MLKKVKTKEMILELKTNNWNKQSKSKQDKALLFMYRVLGELESHRKFGYDPEFWATYP